MLTVRDVAYRTGTVLGNYDAEFFIRSLIFPGNLISRVSETILQAHRDPRAVIKTCSFSALAQFICVRPILFLRRAYLKLIPASVKEHAAAIDTNQRQRSSPLGLSGNKKHVSLSIPVGIYPL